MGITRWSTQTHEPDADQQEALAALRAVAACQRARATTAQAARVGCTSTTIAALVRRGEVERRRQGLLRFATAADDERARDWETVLASGGDPTTAEVLAERAARRKVERGSASPAQAREWRPDPPGQDVALCRGTALRALGVERARRFDFCDVLVGGTSAPTVPWATVHRTRRLEACDRTRLAEVPATTGARSLVDLSPTTAWVDLLALADDTLCARLTSRRWLNRRAVALRPGRPAVQPLIDITGSGAEGLFHSWLERAGARVLADAALPTPEWQVSVHDDRGKVGVVDACWRRGRLDRDVVWELEGLRFHTTPRQRRRDADRFNRLTLCHVVVRHTWEDVVRDPERVVADLERALRQP
jgi:hypothetical protein